MKRCWIFRCLWCSFFVVVTSLVYAQNSQIRVYALEDGLPQSQVYDLAQDSMGYIWVGTQGGGIARFDGEYFQTYNERDGLLSNYIHALYVDRDTLFIGTKHGLSKKYKKQFIAYQGPQINKISKIDGRLILLSNEGVWILNQSGGIDKLNLHHRLDQSICRDITKLNGEYWIASEDGLWKVAALKSSSASPQIIDNRQFTGVVAYGNQVIASSFLEGVHWYSREGELEESLIIKGHIQSTTLLDKTQLWLATNNAGIVVVDILDRNIVEVIDKEVGLSTAHIRKCLKDRQGNIWIGSSGGGLFEYSKNNFVHFNRRKGLKGNRIYAVHQSTDGLWASNSEEGVVRIDSGVVHDVLQPYLDVKVKTITSHKQHLFVGTDGKGILVFPNEKKRAQLERDSLPIIVDTLGAQDALLSNWIRKIITKGNRIYVATYSSGIMSFEYDVYKHQLKKKRTYRYSDGIADLRINDITFDPEGRLWYATATGHLGFVESGEVAHLGKVLPHNTAIRTILFYDDYLFVATSSEGIWFTSIKQPLAFEQLKGIKNLYSDNIYQLIFDDGGQLWAGSERGVDKITLNSSNQIIDVVHYGANDGFLGIETCLNAVDKDEDGNIWFGTVAGLTQYIPTENTKELSAPQLQFENIEVLYQSLDSIDYNLWSTTERVLQLTGKQNHLAFAYRTVDINYPKAVEYRWKLNASNWSPWTTESKINFAGLDYGDYVFSAQSRDINWLESEPVSFRFHIIRPFHKTLEFWWMVYALSALIVMVSVLMILRRIKQKNKAIQERLQLQNYLLSLEQKALQLQMNPHFIFNVLNGIKAMSIADTHKMNETINAFALLLRGTLTNSRKEQISLAEEIATLQHYIKVEQLMTNKEFDYQLTYEGDIDEEEILIPPMLVQPFVENAIRHGIIPIDRKGKLVIIFKVEGEMLSCNVSDNGVGIYQSQAQKTTSSHQSMALQVTKERILSLVGENTLMIKEEKGEKGEILGTIVEFSIPLETDF